MMSCRRMVTGKGDQSYATRYSIVLTRPRQIAIASAAIRQLWSSCQYAGVPLPQEA